MKRVYLDHAATTPIHPRVFEAMLPFLKEQFGNPSSVHAEGRKARYAVEECRERAAAQLGADPSEIVFTSGATEANNTAILGGAGESGKQGILTTAAEHEAVLRPAEALSRAGVPVRVLAPGPLGAVCAAQVADALAQGGIGLVSVMHTNNEVGTLSPVPEIVRTAAQHGASVHTDAVQAAGWHDLKVGDLGIDLLSLSAHKIYGPKGAGLLYVRGGVDFTPLLHGGAQERRRRGGTENLPAIAGLTAALELAAVEREERISHLLDLRRRLLRSLQEALGGRMRLNTPPEEDRAAPHIVSVAFPPNDDVDVDGEMLLLGMDMEGISISAGSACTSGALEPSHVLTAMGLDRATAAAALRFSLGHPNTPEEIDYAVDKLCVVLRRMNAL